MHNIKQPGAFNDGSLYFRVCLRQICHNGIRPSIHLPHLLLHFHSWHIMWICIWEARLTAWVLGPVLALQGCFSPSKGSDGCNRGITFHVQKLMAGYSYPRCLWKLQRHAFKQYPQCRSPQICELYQNSMTCEHVKKNKKTPLVSPFSPKLFWCEDADV